MMSSLPKPASISVWFSKKFHFSLIRKSLKTRTDTGLRSLSPSCFQGLGSFKGRNRHVLLHELWSLFPNPQELFLKSCLCTWEFLLLLFFSCLILPSFQVLSSQRWKVWDNVFGQVWETCNFTSTTPSWNFSCLKTMPSSRPNTCFLYA